MSESDLLSGNFVRVKCTGKAERDLMYGGWFGVVINVDAGMALVDSDRFVRDTGRLQAVSFREWFPLGELEAQTCRGCGLPEVHKMCPAHGTPAYCDSSHPAWGNAEKIKALKAGG